MVAGVCVGAVAAVVLAAGAGSAYGAGGGADPGTAVPERERGYVMRTDARFAPPAALVPSAAVTYDETFVPAGAWIEVGQSTAPDGATSVRLKVRGVKPGHSFGVHVHQKPCAADPAAAGGHYQHVKSTDPHQANPDNEVWLDFTAGPTGSGDASARHDWGFRRGEASSVVLHAEPGNHGSRVGCFTIPFGWTAGTA
ncbi:superoxide dismutase family protein [Streptomyces sp. NPDC091377]|uniref:superoxide dismutase family protein n=1 Tax=Streptomyces sp. NPDC091377 TaxID=3365995 RepID=UPI003826632A